MELSHTERGRRFTERVKTALEVIVGEELEREISLEVRDPPKLHRFDLVSRSRKLVCECKAFTWTESGNVPSAKVTTLREASHYLAGLPDETEKIIAISHSVRMGVPKRLLSTSLGSTNIFFQESPWWN